MAVLGADHPPRSGDSPLSVAGLCSGAAGGAGAAGLAAALSARLCLVRPAAGGYRLLCPGPPRPHPGNADGRGLGLFEDALTHHAIGVNGVAKTVVGFLAGSVGVRIDVENHTIRLMLTFLLSLLSSAIYVFIYRVLLGLDLEWSWLAELMKAVGNSLIALVLFPLLDRPQIKD